MTSRTMERRGQGKKRIDDREPIENFPCATERQRTAAIIESLFDDGLWFRFPYIFLDHMTTDEAIILAYLIFQSNRVKSRDRRNGWDGWFYCRISQMKKDLKMLARRQQRVLKKLKQKKFLGYRRDGIPPRRYFRVDYEQIGQMFMEQM